MMRYGSVIAIISLISVLLIQQILFDSSSESTAITPFFNLVTVWNPGISFGMLQDIPNGQWVLSGVAIVIVVFLLAWMSKVDDRFTAIALGLIIGGALGNIIDRIRFAAVFDYLDFHAFGYHWPAFNLSDSFIFIGVFLLFITSFRQNNNLCKKETLITGE